MKPYIFMAMVIAILASCRYDKKEDTPAPNPYQLPPATQTGANTMGAMINGEVWVAYWPFTDHPLSFPIAWARYFHKDDLDHDIKKGMLNISGGMIDKDTITHPLGLFTEEVFQPGTYQFKDIDVPSSNNVNAKYSYYIIRKFQSYPKQTLLFANYYMMQPKVNQLVITHLDTTKHIISGTFELDMEDTLRHKSIEIRNGRFDITYVP